MSIEMQCLGMVKMESIVISLFTRFGEKLLDAIAGKCVDESINKLWEIISVKFNNEASKENLRAYIIENDEVSKNFVNETVKKGLESDAEWSQSLSNYINEYHLSSDISNTIENNKGSITQNTWIVSGSTLDLSEHTKYTSHDREIRVSVGQSLLDLYNNNVSNLEENYLILKRHILSGKKEGSQTIDELVREMQRQLDILNGLKDILPEIGSKAGVKICTRYGYFKRYFNVYKRKREHLQKIKLIKEKLIREHEIKQEEIKAREERKRQNDIVIKEIEERLEVFINWLVGLPNKYKMALISLMVILLIYVV